MLESTVERFLHKRVRLVGGTTFKLLSTTRGMPDRLVILPGGKMYLVETKSPTGEPSPIQKAWHEKISALGVHVYVLHSQEQVVRWLKQRLPSLDR